MSTRPLESANVTLVETPAEAQAMLDWLRQPRGLLAFDVETRGLDWWEPDFTRLLQFGDATQAWCVGVKEWRQLCRQALDIVIGSRTPLVGHNVGFDMHALDGDGLPIPEWRLVHDTLVMDHLHYPIRAHGLKNVAAREYGGSAKAGQWALDKHFAETGTDWATVDINAPAYWFYAGVDTILTARLAELRGAQLAQRGLWTPYEREMAAKAVLWRAERRGIHVHHDYTEQLLAAWEAEQVQLLMQLDAWGVQNPNAKADVVAALKRKEDWDPEEFTETGEPKLTKGILSTLDSRIAPLVLRYKRLEKWNQVYLRKFLSGSAIDGRAHPNINTLAARTGRMSVTGGSGPLQTLPSKEASVRDCLGPDEGNWLWAIDYDAQELRVMASLSNDEGLIRLFEEGRDPHSFIASVVYGLDYETVVANKEDKTTEEYRRRGTSKNTVYSRIYGAGTAKIAETAGVPEREIEEFSLLFDRRFPRTKQCMLDLMKTAQQRMKHEGEPYITTAGGRWVNVEPDKIYALMNYQIQGDCADLLKEKIILLDKAGYGENIMLPVHDEVLFQFPEGETDAPEDCRRLLEEHDRYCVPLTCGLSKPGLSWGALYR